MILNSILHYSSDKINRPALLKIYNAKPLVDELLGRR